MKRGVWIGFAGLCLLSGSRWLLDAAVSPALPPLLRTALHQALLFIVCTVVVTVRPGQWDRFTWRHALLLAGLAGAVWVVPDAVIAGAGGHVTGLTEALVFTLAPAVVVFAVSQQTWEFGAQANPHGLLGPALAGMAGAALLLPFTMPPSTVGKLWLGALVVSAMLAGLAAVQLHSLLRDVPIFAAAALASGTIALVGAACAHSGWALLGTSDTRALLVEVLIGLTVDGPLLLLGLWLLRAMPPIAFGTRYLLILLVAIAESYVLQRPTAGWIMAGGALLMAGGAAWLLRASVREGSQGVRDDSGSTLLL